MSTTKRITLSSRLCPWNMKRSLCVHSHFPLFDKVEIDNGKNAGFKTHGSWWHEIHLRRVYTCFWVSTVSRLQTHLFTQKKHDTHPIISARLYVGLVATKDFRVGVARSRTRKQSGKCFTYFCISCPLAFICWWLWLSYSIVLRFRPIQPQNLIAIPQPFNWRLKRDSSLRWKQGHVYGLVHPTELRKGEWPQGGECSL